MRNNSDYILSLINRTIVILQLSLCLGGVFSLQAQGIKKEVYVESTFRPEISDANKIGTMPTIDDTLSFSTRIDYTVLPGTLKSDFTPRPIKPAKMVGTPLDKLYNSYLKAGIGNYTSPLLEYSIQNLRSREYSVGAYVFHKSSHYQQQIVDTVGKVPAGYSRTEISAYGKKFYEDVNVMADVGATIQRIRHYGLNPDSMNNASEVVTEDIKQSYYTLYAKTGIYSTAPDSAALAYTLYLQGDYLWDYFDTKEPHFGLEGSVSHPVHAFLLGLDGFYHFYNLKSRMDTTGEGILSIHPFLSKRSDLWQIYIAGRLCLLNRAGYNKTYFYPDLNIKFKVIDNAMMLFFGITGSLENNSYASIVRENPFVTPGLEVANTNHQYVFFAGLDGYLSSKAAYKVEVSLDARDSVHFYVNDTVSRYGNEFNVIYDNADLVKLHAELNWNPLSYLGFFIRVNTYNYKMSLESIEPWHKPGFDFILTTSYNFKQKIYADIDFLILGKRYVANYLSISDDPEVVTLDPVYDLNLKLEYKYSNVLGIFLDFYNLTNTRYYLWNQYQSQRLCVMAGVNYKF